MGGLSAGALAGCAQKPTLSADNVYTNNFYVPGAGYYHAPFRAWYPLPYNDYSPENHQFFYGGQWGPGPFASITNLSSPTAELAALAQLLRTDISRGGFGYGGGYYGGGGYYHSWSGFSG